MVENPHSDPPPAPSQDDLLHRLRERADLLRDRAQARFELERGRRRSVRKVFEFYQRDRAFAGSLLAGGVAVKLFLWFLPFSLSAVLILGLLGDSLDQPASDLATQAGLTVALAGVVEDAVATTSRGRIYIASFAIALLLWTALGVARSLRLVWGATERARINPLMASWWRRSPSTQHCTWERRRPPGRSTPAHE